MNYSYDRRIAQTDPQKAVDDWLGKSKMSDLILAMSRHAKKEGHQFGMRDARAVFKSWFGIATPAPSDPKLAAGFAYLKTPKGEKAIGAIVKGVGAALKGAGGGRGFRDIAKAVDTWMGY